MYCYLKCIVYDKLLKPRQSFRITLYIKFILHHLLITHLIPIFFAVAAFVVLFDPEGEDLYYFEISVTV